MKSNILVVDDEPVARQSLTDILKLEGYTVASAPNGQAAVEYIHSQCGSADRGFKNARHGWP